jgi:hypothetical protein
MKVLKPKKFEEYSSWIWADGEHCNANYYAKVETMPRELELIFPVEKYFTEYKTFTK